jgi:hypothetical protein
MRFKALVLALAAAAGCGNGNYSNEDLEFMSALPERGDVVVTIPTQSPLVPAEMAELYVSTRAAVNDFNDLVTTFLGLIDGIRSRAPQSRLTDERIWGPLPADGHPGWDVQMVVDRNVPVDGGADVALGYAYRLDLRRSGTLTQPGTSWTTLLSGSYQAMGGVRRGIGQMDITTQPLRDAGFDPGLGHLVAMHVDFDTSHFPISVSSTVTNVNNSGNDGAAVLTAQYHYRTQSDGRAALAYDLWADAVAGTGGVEKLSVTSAWLGTGEGRADATIVEGDAINKQQTECWNQQFRAVYNDKPWAADENVPADPPGEPALYCQPIPAL